MVQALFWLQDSHRMTANYIWHACGGRMHCFPPIKRPVMPHLLLKHTHGRQTNFTEDWKKNSFSPLFSKEERGLISFFAFSPNKDILLRMEKKKKRIPSLQCLFSEQKGIMEFINGSSWIGQPQPTHLSKNTRAKKKNDNLRASQNVDHKEFQIQISF